MNQKLLRKPTLTKISAIPGAVRPSNIPKTQKQNDPIESKKNFLRITPVALIPFIKNPNPRITIIKRIIIAVKIPPGDRDCKL